MNNTGEIRRRIQNAEYELRVAKNELTRLQAEEQTPINRIAAYLSSIGCLNIVNESCGRPSIVIQDGYYFNLKGLYRAAAGKEIEFNMAKNRITITEDYNYGHPC